MMTDCQTQRRRAFDEPEPKFCLESIFDVSTTPDWTVDTFFISYKNRTTYKGLTH